MTRTEAPTLPEVVADVHRHDRTVEEPPQLLDLGNRQVELSRVGRAPRGQAALAHFRPRHRHTRSSSPGAGTVSRAALRPATAGPGGVHRRADYPRTNRTHRVPSDAPRRVR